MTLQDAETRLADARRRAAELRAHERVMIELKIADSRLLVRSHELIVLSRDVLADAGR
jgi:hypothetical protein